MHKMQVAYRIGSLSLYPVPAPDVTLLCVTLELQEIDQLAVRLCTVLAESLPETRPVRHLGIPRSL